MRVAIAIAIVSASAGRADAKGCHETSYVVGFEHCSGFGEWSRDSDIPRLWIELGMFDHHYASHRFALGHTEQIDQEPSSLRTNTRGALLRIAGGLSRLFYVGGELEIGDAEIESGLRGLPPSGGGDAGALHAFAGLHAEVDRLSFATELATGFRSEAFYACASAACSQLSAGQNHGELEARFRGELFVAGGVSAALTFGQSLLDSRDHQIIVTLGFHIRAIDGM